ncbi:hypothetical protein J8L70_12470 [Pseudoalteromonas sp. MMG010]|uniref:tetratricopeptide repeat protein n=1 Tax=Pseudoalteromonas sp. MMG010 TaxID=2822685 RepID=UPI001B3A23C6|nr:hypothetical protein [Pseudoalteromonas sp. MMG010]MBQ4834059.1 hypothetical protein [Pseudoalteromonas sp. MMG010]
MKKLFIILCLSSVFLSGCNSTSTAKTEQSETFLSLHQLINHSLFQQQKTPSEEAIFTLSKAQKKRFLNYAKQHFDTVRADRIIYNYLEEQLSDFKYYGETLSATESVSLEKGNCISLAIVTQSYAELLGLETSFQEVSSTPIYAQQGNLIYVSKHLRTKVYAPPPEKKKGVLSLFRSGTLIDYFPTRGSFYSGNASYNDLVSMFYSNLAGDTLQKKQYDFAYSFIIQANKYTPNHPELFNMAAILHRRMGDKTSAQHIYQTALEQDNVSVNLLSNYRILAQEMGDHALIEQINRALINDEKDPYELLVIAANARQQGALIRAKSNLELAITKAPYIADLYLELAKVHFQQGHTARTQSLLSKAIELERDKQKLNIYQAKLLALSNIN